MKGVCKDLDLHVSKPLTKDFSINTPLFWKKKVSTLFYFYFEGNLLRLVTKFQWDSTSPLLLFLLTPVSH